MVQFQVSEPCTTATLPRCCATRRAPCSSAPSDTMHCVCLCLAVSLSLSACLSRPSTFVCCFYMHLCQAHKQVWHLRADQDSAGLTTAATTPVARALWCRCDCWLYLVLRHDASGCGDDHNSHASMLSNGRRACMYREIRTRAHTCLKNLYTCVHALVNTTHTTGQDANDAGADAVAVTTQSNYYNRTG